MVRSNYVQLIQATEHAVKHGAVIVMMDIILSWGIVITAIQMDLYAPLTQATDHADNLIVPRYQAELKP